MSDKILIVNQCAHGLTVDIANAFAKSQKYKEVVIVLGNQLDSIYHLEDSVKLHKIKEYITKSTLTRLISWVIATLQLILLCLWKYRDYELFLISNPPIDSFVPNFCANEYSTLIFDVYPDGLGNFASKKSLIYRIWARNNIKFYKKAKYVYTLTESMAKTIAQYCPLEKIEVVPLWCNSFLPVFDIQKQNNKFLNEHPELKGKFIIMYSGNVGLDHDISCLLDVMNNLRGSKICLVIIGEGYNKTKLQERARELHLEECCYFYPFQPTDMLPYSLSSADISVVATKPNGRSSSIPSKVFSLMQYGRPILCLADSESEIARLVKKHTIGVVFHVSEVPQLTDFIKQVSQTQELLVEYGQNSKKSAELYTNKNALRFVK